jgi:hypothetical protein
MGPNFTGTNLIFMQKACLIFFCAYLTLDSCGLDIEDSTPPSKPQWIEKSMPDEWPERGVDAHENSDIYLEWENNPDEDIEAYYVYRAEWDNTDDDMSKFILLVRLEAESLQKAEYLDDQASTGVEYFYKLRSLDDSNNLSSYSDSVHYELLPNIGVQTMIPNAVSDQLGESRILSWQYTYTIAMENYQVTILTKSNEIVHRSTFSPGDYTGSGLSEWIIPQDVFFVNGEVYKWRIDTAAKYVSGKETSGSESNWAYFYYLDN